MKKKVFFILSSFAAGGAERVFWIICQAFDKTKFDVTVVLLDTRNNAFSLNLPDIRIIDLKTIKASNSFITLLRFIRIEKPYAIYTTGSHINMLVSFVSYFSKIPYLIARGTNIPHERKKYSGLKSKVFSMLGIFAYRNFNYFVCQSKEMYNSWSSNFLMDINKLVVIPNPVIKPEVIRRTEVLKDKKEIIVVGRISSVKGHDRLLNIFSRLPENYCLTIAGGDGGEMGFIKNRIIELNLISRIKVIGEINDVCNIISQHSLLVLSSYTEGFPNVILEALSVGTPVVTFKVGGVSDFIIDGFNGYIVEQGNSNEFGNCIVKASNMYWNHKDIANDIQRRFSVPHIVKQYENLITTK